MPRCCGQVRLLTKRMTRPTGFEFPDAIPAVKAFPSEGERLASRRRDSRCPSPGSVGVTNLSAKVRFLHHVSAAMLTVNVNPNHAPQLKKGHGKQTRTARRASRSGHGRPSVRWHGACCRRGPIVDERRLVNASYRWVWPTAVMSSSRSPRPAGSEVLTYESNIMTTGGRVMRLVRRNPTHSGAESTVSTMSATCATRPTSS